MVRLGVLYTLNHGSSPCEQTLKIINYMKEVYKKLLENLANMTSEQKVEEWEALKKYNDIGPEVKEIIKIK